VIYTLSVSSNEKRIQLISALKEGVNNDNALSSSRAIVKDAGTALYVMTKMEQHCQRAQQILENVNSDSLAYEKMMNILNYVKAKAGQ
jgi:hypothetical protein